MRILGFTTKKFFKAVKVYKNLLFVAFSAGILVGLIPFGVYFLSQKNSSAEDAQAISQVEDSSDEEILQKEIKIDLRGAVASPGVYKMGESDIVDDLIEEAGGFTKDYDKDWVDQNINFASVMTEGQKIYIPFKGQKDSEAKQADTPPNQSSGLVSVNNATSAELESLPGVGPSTAQKIIDGRPYAKLEDLLDVKGIGDSTFEKLKDKISL